MGSVEDFHQARSLRHERVPLTPFSHMRAVRAMVNRKSVLRSAFTLLVVILLAASCGKKEEPKTAPPTPAPTATLSAPDPVADPTLPVPPPPASPGSFTCGDATCDPKKEYCRTDLKGAALRPGEQGSSTSSCLALPAACTTAKSPTCACFGKVSSCTCLPEDGPRFRLTCSTRLTCPP
jgi:hypothetical protein